MKRWFTALTAIVLTMLLTGALAAGYTQGNTIKDFEVTTPEGETLSLTGLLEDHDAVLLNFWYADCSWCGLEFPFMNAAWEEQEAVAVLALTPYDSDAAIAAYREKMGIAFPMARDTADLAIEFGVSGFPTSVMIDRNGVWCATVSTTLETAAFRRLFEAFSGDGYTESKVGYQLPEVTPDAPEFPGQEALAAAYDTDDRVVFSKLREGWPLVMGEDGKAELPKEIPLGTTAALGITVEASQGDVLLIEMDIRTAGGKSLVCAAVDGETTARWSGSRSVGYALPLTEGSHAVTLYYQRGYYAGPYETMKLKRIRLLSGEAARIALEENPGLPTADRCQILPEEGTEIRFLQKGEPLSLKEGMRVFLIDPSDLTLHLTVTAEMEPGTMFLNAESDYALADMETDESGFVLTLKSGNPAIVAQLYDAMTGKTAQSVLLLGGETIADMLAAQFGEEVTWERAETVPTILVTDGDGNPVEGVRLSLCRENTCRMAETDAHGEVSCETESEGLHVQILSVPEPYEAEQGEYDLTDSELKIILRKKGS